LGSSVPDFDANALSCKITRRSAVEIAGKARRARFEVSDVPARGQRARTRAADRDVLHCARPKTAESPLRAALPANASRRRCESVHCPALMQRRAAPRNPTRRVACGNVLAGADATRPDFGRRFALRRKPAGDAREQEGNGAGTHRERRNAPALATGIRQ
jgi:hypothetical protein